MKRNGWIDWGLVFMWGCGVTLVALFALMFAAVWADNKQWQAFKVEHHCRVVREISGDTGIGTGVGANGSVGVVTVVTAGKTCWLCDDGVERCR